MLAACSETQLNQPSSVPVEPEVVNILTSCAVAQDSIDAMLPQLFTPGSQRGQSVSLVNKMNKALRQNNTALARQYMWEVINLATTSYYANPSKITGGRSANSTRRVQDLISGLLCLNGFGLLNPIIDPNGAAGVVIPGTETTVGVPDQTSPGENLAATVVGANDLPAGTPAALVTIRTVPGPLDTKLDQYGPYYEFDVTPSVTFANPVLAGACINTAGLAEALVDRLRLAHNHSPSDPLGPGNSQFGNIEIIAPDDLTPLNLGCDPLVEVGFVNKFKNRFKALFLPERLYAVAVEGSGGSGGKVRNYSPFAAVDPLLTVTANPATTSATAGTPVSVPPSVTVTSDSGHLIPGVNVGFAVTVGAGSIAPASVTTGTNGVAATTSWILSVGSNTAVATPSQAGLSFTPASVSFTATGLAAVTASPFDWEATGWTWKPVATWSGYYPADGTVTAAAAAATGYSGPVQAAFSRTGNPNTGCSAYSTYISRIHSTIFDVNTVIALRRDFTMAEGATSGTISFAVDNDFRVFVNGTEETSSLVFHPGGDDGSSSGGTASGFRKHDGCPSRGDFTLYLTGLSSTNNTLVVIALDRGGSTYFDASVDSE